MSILRWVLTLLEGKLAGCVPERVEICNLGIPALDPIDYLQLLSLEGERLDPDLVLVCLFAGNDFVRTARGSRLRLRNSRTFSVLWRLWRLHREAVRRRTAPRTSRQPLSGFVPPPAFSDATYRPNDSHWNTRGNRVAADALVPDLEIALRICGATHPDTRQKTGPS